MADIYIYEFQLDILELINMSKEKRNFIKVMARLNECHRVYILEPTKYVEIKIWDMPGSYEFSHIKNSVIYLEYKEPNNE